MRRTPPPRLELLQGTFELLTLRTLLLGLVHGHAIAKHIRRTSEELLQVETGSLTPRSIAWKQKAGLPPLGNSPKRASVPATTASLSWGENSSTLNNPDGTPSLGLSR